MPDAVQEITLHAGAAQRRCKFGQVARGLSRLNRCSHVVKWR